MFEHLDNCEYLELMEISETYQQCLTIVVAEATTGDEITSVSKEEEPLEEVRDLLSGSRSIEIRDSSEVFQISFEDYIAYGVSNESYAGGKFKEEYKGKYARVYRTSAFLNFIEQGTFATSDYPGPFKHYAICCLNQIIDVVSVEPPKVVNKCLTSFQSSLR